MKSKRSNKEGSNSGGSNNWETIPIKDIKEILPKDIVGDILRLGEYDRIRQRPITLEMRFRRAYKYHLWHEANFINGVHKNSKYRLVLENMK